MNLLLADTFSHAPAAKGLVNFCTCYIRRRDGSNVAMGPPKPLDAQGQSVLADAVRRHVGVDARGRPRPLIELALNDEGEDVVTKGVMGRHLEVMLDVCTALPIAAPSKASVIKPLKDCLMWQAAGGSTGKVDVTPAVAQKWSEDNAERLCMCWRYAWASYGRGPGSRCYALNRLKSCFDQGSTAARAMQKGHRELEPTGSQIAAETITDSDDTSADELESLPDDCPSVADDEVVVISPKAAAKPPAAKSPTRRMSNKRSDPESIQSDSPPQKRRTYVSVEQLLPPPAAPAKAPAAAATAAPGAPPAAAAAEPPGKAPAATAPPAHVMLSPPVMKTKRPPLPPGKAPADTSKFSVPPPAHVMLTPPPAARDVTPPVTRRALKDRIRRVRTPPPPGVEPPSSPAFDSTVKAKRVAKRPAKSPAKAKGQGDVVLPGAGDDASNQPAAEHGQRNFVESAEDRLWGARKLRAITQGARPAFRPDIPVCFEKCRKKEMVERTKVLMQFTRRLLGQKEEVLGQITQALFKDRFYEVSDILFYTAGQGYSKADFLRVKTLLLNAD